LRLDALWALLATGSTLAFSPPARALEYHVDTTAANEVRFISDAPIEDFAGTTRRIDGYVFWPGDSLASGTAYDKSELYFEVELDALDTGIDLRNRHMRENYLETDRFPYASYRGTIESVAALPSGGWRVHSKGKLSIHGVERDYSIQCDVDKDGAGYSLKSSFQVRLPDFKIKVPSLMFMKISETIELELTVHLQKAESK
jgi:polyisoprenoid-binding protein YceI